MYKDRPIAEGVLDDIDWVIAGGESGPGAKPMQPLIGPEVSVTSAAWRESLSSSSSGDSTAWSL